MYHTYTDSELERAAYIDPTNIAAVREMSARFFDVAYNSEGLEARVEELENELDEEVEDRQKLDARADELEAERDQLKDKLDEAQREIETLKSHGLDLV
ncbi:hypothetical protein [Cupriavidus metallidurans]|uniref:hypothetical protein n=1 Tax=Cupriavidus metallidurans TaxID=119219 RepID=UPI0035C6F74B